MTRRVPLLIVLLAAMATGLPSSPAAAAAPPEDAYIVVLRDGTDARSVAAEHRARHGARVSHVYGRVLDGYAARISGRELGAVRSDPRVAYVERDGEVRASATQSNATWGLDRVDQRALPLSTSYTYDATGAGVTAYIVDTGLRYSHAEFSGRAVEGYDAFGGNGSDCDGHGTHVGGTVGGEVYGVAKDVALVSVRVLDCSGSGTWSGVIAGLDWIAGHHAADAPAVANMSLGGGASSSVDAAVQRTIDDGVTVAVAAGNGNMGGKEQDACNYSPARVGDAITIGATQKSDAKTSWSNYGPCVDWFAPGYQITSAWYGSDTQTNTISGTSMAAPHVAGAAALYLQTDSDATPATVRQKLYDATTKGIVTSSRTANNHLLYTFFDPLSQPANAAPTAGFTYSCTDLTCSFTSTSQDSDGSIASHAWSFGDGTTSSATNPSHTYAAAGTYTVTLTVTDDDGATGTTSQPVAVSSTAAEIALQATVSGPSHKPKVDLSWTGSTASSMDVYRNGDLIATTANNGKYRDAIAAPGSYTYEVCEAGTSTCSNDSTVTIP